VRFRPRRWPVEEPQGGFAVVAGDLAELIKDAVLVSLVGTAIAFVDGLEILPLPTMTHVENPLG
jgi:hypothetical protein